jgi:hypothetical protein
LCEAGCAGDCPGRCPLLLFLFFSPEASAPGAASVGAEIVASGFADG